MSTIPTTLPAIRPDEAMQTVSGPAWEIAMLFPDQGDLSEGDYLTITEHSRKLVEFSDGRIEVLNMPTTRHQRIILYLVTLLRAFAARGLGEALISPLRVRLGPGKFREPDIVFMMAANGHRIHNQFWDGADLVMEVVSDDDPNRDLIIKREEYARAGIAEYWIVDPRASTIAVLKLDGGQYIVHEQLAAAGTVHSALLQGFSVDVAAVFAAADPKPMDRESNEG